MTLLVTKDLASVNAGDGCQWPQKLLPSTCLLGIARSSHASKTSQRAHGKHLFPFRPLTFPLTCLCLVFYLGFYPGATFGGVITNGDFAVAGGSAPFANWSTAPGLMRPVDGGGQARFVAGDVASELTQLAQMFDLPSGASGLSFEYRLTQSAGTSGGGNASDSFSAVLLDASLKPVRPIDSFLPGFFSVEPTNTAAGFEELLPNSGVTTSALSGGWRRVALTLPPFSPGRYTIGFVVRSDSDNRTTNFDIDNVMLVEKAAIVPEPASVAVWGILSLGALPALRRKRCR